VARIVDIVPGSRVEWDTAGGAVARAEVVSVSRDGIAVRSSDGHVDYHPTGAFLGLQDIVARWRVTE
jgi:hypothetical protein